MTMFKSDLAVAATSLANAAKREHVRGSCLVDTVSSPARFLVTSLSLGKKVSATTPFKPTSTHIVVILCSYAAPRSGAWGHAGRPRPSDASASACETAYVANERGRVSWLGRWVAAGRCDAGGV